ncbi:MAG: RsmD family RNA methyltransferase [Gammaproteobacteria bacterium]|nr:RsmD family RNA methyltransferase [Gammaproteobacteria bacterium]
MRKNGQVRIIGGRWRSRRLRCAAVRGLRPSPDALRETLFNWLAARLPGAACLDLFAGSGALGFEAASRGAAHVALVESHPRAVAALRANRAALQAEGQVDIFPGRAMRFLRGGGDGNGGDGDGRGESGESNQTGDDGDGHSARNQTDKSNDTPGRRFDIIFLDPPFAAPGLLAAACQNLRPHLNPRALIYIESPPAAALPLAADWRIIRRKRRGAAQSTLIQT